MKIILLLLGAIFYNTAVQADSTNIIMYGKEKYGFDQPKYQNNYLLTEKNNRFDIFALADPENFPISSSEQGSIFEKIFSKLDNEDIRVIFQYEKKYEDAVVDFERGKIKNINARFGVYYKEMPYSKNEYVYPAFFENKIYILTAAKTKLTLNGKAELKNYKGAYVKNDKLPDYIYKEFASLGIISTESWLKAFELLLTDQIDYIAASYYPSIIETYKLGLREYVTYSKNPVWKISMFLRVSPNLMKQEKMVKFRAYLKSQQYKKLRDDAFNELVEIYKENTQGVVPPKFINTQSEEANLQDEQV